MSRASGRSSERIAVDQEIIEVLHRVREEDFAHLHEHHTADGGKRTWRSMASRLIHAPGFDYFMGGVILLNLFVLIIETDRTVMETDAETSGLHWTEVFGWMALVLFCVELGLRLLVFQCIFFRDVSNLCDFAIVSTDAVFSVIGLVAGGTFPVSILRVFRLAKLARVFKVLRVFPELRLLLAGLISSISAILWGTLLLFFCILIWSMVAVLLIHPLNMNIDYEKSSCERCPRAYSSVMQATLTIFQQIVTGDSWGAASVPLMEQYPITVLFFVPVFLSVGMAVTNLILGVVVSVAQQAKEALQQEDHAEKALKKLEMHTHLVELCKEMDVDNSGELSHDEVFEAFQKEGDFRTSILAMDITEEDFEIIWQIIDNENRGSVSYKEFVTRLSTMKVSDTQFMLAYIKYYITMLRHEVLTEMSAMHDEAMKTEEKIKQVCEMEAQVINDIYQMEQKEERIMERMVEHDRQLMDRSEQVLVKLSEEPQAERPTEEKASASKGSSAVQAEEKEEKEDKGKDHHQDNNGQNNTVSQEVDTLESTDLSRGMKEMAALLGHACQDIAVLGQACQDISTLKIELKDMLMDMNSKLRPLKAPLLSLQTQEKLNAEVQSLDRMSTDVQPELLVVPDKESCCNRAWCKPSAPVEKNVSRIPGQRSEWVLPPHPTQATGEDAASRAEGALLRA